MPDTLGILLGSPRGSAEWTRALIRTKISPMPPNASELSAETQHFPPRTSAKLFDGGGLVVVVLRGTGTLVIGESARIVGAGEAVALPRGTSATFTAGPGSTGVDLLRVRLDGALERGALERGGAPVVNGAHTPSAIATALALMEGDLARRWTVLELSRRVGLSRAAFARLFKANTGESPLRRLTRRRLDRAAELLLTSELTLAEIAERVGYESEFAFNRAFKRRHGLPPGAFRRGGTTRPMLMRAA